MSKSVKFVKIVSPIALAIALAACGGGGSGANFGSNTGGGTTGGGTVGGTTETLASSIELSVSSRQLPSDGSTPITITAIAKDANNNAIDGADIIFSVDKDATIIKDATVTTVIDPDNPSATPLTTVVSAGSIQTATLTPGSSTNQTLNITVISGSTSKSITVDVVGTTVTIEGPSGITLGQDSPYVLKLKDSSNNPIAFQQVVLSSANGNQILTDSNFETDAEGEIAFNLNSSSSGTDIVSASVLGASFEKAVDVSGDEFKLSNSNNEEIDIKTVAPISFKWTKDGVAQAGKTIVLSATRGDIGNQSTVTNSAGEATFTISSQTAGQTVITATSTEGLSTSLSREFIATTPKFLNTQATPALIAPNTSSTIVAKIRDEDDNPVKNKIIDFRLKDTIDGVLSASTATTDSLGRASVSYTAGNSSSQTNGVEITTFVQGYPSVATDKVAITVGGNALRLVLGDDQLIAFEDIFYIKQFGVIVTDSAGNPIKDKDVTFKITPTEYYKGFMSSSNRESWVRFNTLSNRLGDNSASCISEDFDNDGNLDFDKGEDINNNGTLEPTRDATVTGSGKTDESGRIIVEVVYPKSSALWSKQEITATTQVEGTEFVETTEFILPILADDVDDITISPPNTLSPYGLGNRCDDPADNFSLPITPTVVNGLTGLEVGSIMNDNVYRVRFTDALGNNVDGQNYTITSSVADITSGLPNGSFSVADNDVAVDGSGFYIELESNGVTTILFYEDEPATTAVTTPVEPDEDAPEIFISGQNPISITQGDTYTDAGATAVDLIDGSVNVTVVSGLPINTNIIGTQSIVYRAVDGSNNASQAVREVIIVPPDVPLIILDDATSIDNVFNDLVLNVGDVYFPNESAIDLEDGAVTVNVSGDPVPVDGLNRTITAGTYNVIYTAVDTDGNVATATRTVIVNP